MIYAIDFGTCNSLLAQATAENASQAIKLDPSHYDPTIMRSTMFFSDHGGVTFGQSAIKTYIAESGEGRFIRSIKKFLPSKNFTATRIGSKTYELEYLIGRFLREMKQRADAQFQQNVESVVLGRPAKYSPNEAEDKLAQERMHKAAMLAGFKNVYFFPEPLAAAFDYRKTLKGEKLILIVDLGAGTSDFTVIRLRSEGFTNNDVLSLGGISVAGDALDGMIMSEKIGPHLGTGVSYRFPMSSNVLTMPTDLKFRLMSPADITLMQKSDIIGFLEDVSKSTVNKDDRQKIERLFTLIGDNLGFAIFEEIESCKRSVCTNGKGEFNFSYADLEITETLPEKNFIDITEGKISAIFKSMDDVILNAGIKASDIDLICCTGGTSKVPEVHSRLLKRFGPDKIRTLGSFHSVIQGLSERAKDLLND